LAGGGVESGCPGAFLKGQYGRSALVADVDHHPPFCEAAAEGLKGSGALADLLQALKIERPQDSLSRVSNEVSPLDGLFMLAGH